MIYPICEHVRKQCSPSLPKKDRCGAGVFFSSRVEFVPVFACSSVFLVTFILSRAVVFVCGGACMVCFLSQIYVATTDRSLHAYRLKGRKDFTLKMPALVTQLEVVQTRCDQYIRTYILL